MHSVLKLVIWFPLVCILCDVGCEQVGNHVGLDSFTDHRPCSHMDSFIKHAGVGLDGQFHLLCWRV